MERVGGLDVEAGLAVAGPAVGLVFVPALRETTSMLSATMKAL